MRIPTSLPSFGAIATIATIATATLLLAPVAPGAASAHAASLNAAGLPDFSALVEKAGPAVVNIRTTEKVAASGDDAEMDELLRRFFGVPPAGPGATPRGALPPRHPPVTPNAPKEQGGDDADPGRPQAGPQAGRVQRGVGSGFIISQDGYLLTNAHVVDGADEVFVKMTDRREFKARVVGTDKRTDVAVLKIEASRLPTIGIGASGTTKVGEWVVAIGSPFDLDNSVTAGIVSAKSRETGDFLPLIQTDVPINPGNSGGPLINMRGEVVGINSQIYSRSGGFMGISFAIPIEDAIRVADQLRSGGRVTRGRLGVYLSDVDREIATSLGLPKPEGALVGRIERGGPAEQAGLRDGDIILGFDGKPIERSAELRRLAAATRPGAKADLSVWRNGATKQLSVTLAELEPPQAVAKAEAAPPAPKKAGNALGLSVGELTASQKAELGGRTGAVVEQVDGAAERAGLRAGDILLALNNVDVDGAQGFGKLAAQAGGKPAVALVRRGDTSQYIVLRPPGTR